MLKRRFHDFDVKRRQLALSARHRVVDGRGLHGFARKQDAAWRRGAGNGDGARRCRKALFSCGGGTRTIWVTSAATIPPFFVRSKVSLANNCALR